MSNKISYSKISKYMQCPMAYKYYYIDKLRSRTNKASLLFGTAIDAAITSLLKTKEKSPIDVFSYFWRFQELQGKKTYLPNCPDIVYAEADYDEELLQERDILELKTKLNLENPIEEINKIYKAKEIVGFKNLQEYDKVVLNYANWLCMYRKGLLMLEAFEKKVLPNIQKVHGVQVHASLKKGEDTLSGFADLVCTWKNSEKPIIMDIKTSMRKYEEDSVLTSPQLSLYVRALSKNYENTRMAGYIVLDKKVKKNRVKICSKCEHNGTGTRFKTCPNIVNDIRCDSVWNEKIKPEVMIDVIVDEIPEQTQKIVMDNLTFINESIKCNNFHRNLQSCKNTFGGLCEYINLCYKNSKEDLIDLEK